MSAILQPLRAGRFRHIVFATGYGSGRAMDFTPAPPHEPVESRRRSSLSAEEESFVSYLFRSAGLDARDYRPETLRRRLPACLRALHVTTPRNAKAALEENPKLLGTALDAMVIGVTSFFRDAAVFDHLTYHVLPMLAVRRREVRIWSAGCSDGGELYSVAILLSEMGMLSRACLLGTDCRPEAVRQARQASYQENELKEVPTPWLKQYFRRERGSWRISTALAEAVQWRTGDVLAVREPGMWDLILCRNLAMYLRPEVGGRLWQQLEETLRPGGYLVLGKAERPLGTSRLSGVAPCIYRRDRG